VRAVVSDPRIKEVYEANLAAAQRNRLAGQITEAVLDTIEHDLKGRAIRRYHEHTHRQQGQMRRAA
jgi:hypothetical protein